jgi:hypothetical protein
VGYTYHVVETGRTQFSHHRLREGIVRSLEQPKHDVVCPALPCTSEGASPARNPAQTYQNSQALWKPNLRVHKPIMPQRGIRTVTTFVTTNWNCPCEPRASIDIRSRRCNSPSSSWGFSSIFGCTRSQACCPTLSVVVSETIEGRSHLTVDVIACERPR